MTEARSVDRKRLLLISNSKPHGGGYLDHCEQAIKQFLDPIKNILFFPFAIHDHNGYAKVARERFARMEIDLTSAHEVPKRRFRYALETADAYFVGGGNTFRLLRAMDVFYDDFVTLTTIKERVFAGTPYIGTSAGANLACPTIGTTNDMPIQYPPRGFYALNVFPFQINPHYVDPDPSSTHMGETRDTRLKEFHEENETPVIALREGAWLRVERGVTHLEGRNGAKFFRRGYGPVELTPGPLDIEP